jgi:phage shock protein C
MVEKKLYRSEYNRMIAGVCAGIAEYLDIDPTVIRLIWVLFTFFVGSGVLVYIIACLIIPNENEIKK